MRYYLSLLLAVILFSCTSRNTGKKSNRPFSIDSVKAHIIKMNESYSQRFMSNDTAYYADRYCKDAQVFSPGVPAVVSRDSIIKFFYGDGSNTDATIELPIGDVYGNEDMVVEEGTYNFPDGKGGSLDKGKFIALWKEEDGKWKLYREIWNTDLMPPAASK